MAGGLKSIALLAAALAAHAQLLAQHAGSDACRNCHPDKFATQSKSGHAHALAVGAPGAAGQWAFGAGEKATTWVSQKANPQALVEHGLTYFASVKAMRTTPGHTSATDTVYPLWEPVGTALRCFRCHSTGPVQLQSGKIAPAELGVRCEACHGGGLAHSQAGGGRGNILNPKDFNASEINELCGACHRQASALDDDTDWGNAWNIRHQPAYLHRAACFRNSQGAVSCLTCHNPHEPVAKTAAAYDAKCASCHRQVAHKTAVAGRACVDCHMPQATVLPGLRFTNHWIGIYADPGPKLVPARRSAKTLGAAPPLRSGLPNPSSPATLTPLYQQALAATERSDGPQSPAAARANANLALFLRINGDIPNAENSLRRAVELDRTNKDRQLWTDLENLASVITAPDRKPEAIALYREAAEGPDPIVAARSLGVLPRLDPEYAEEYLRGALAAESVAKADDGRRVATLLHELALALRARAADKEAEPLLRRALAIQDKVAKPDFRVTAGVLNTLGNLLQGAHQIDEAERLERRALALSEQKFGPESPELAMTCTNLADVLWTRKDLAGAEAMYRRSVAVDSSLYGPEATETAADMANLGMLLKEAGKPAESGELLRHALGIYEKALGPNSPQAEYVRRGLTQ
jgi:tetratricopeptide (TPR) repeat protein